MHTIQILFHIFMQDKHTKICFLNNLLAKKFFVVVRIDFGFEEQNILGS